MKKFLLATVGAIALAGTSQAAPITIGTAAFALGGVTINDPLIQSGTAFNATIGVVMSTTGVLGVVPLMSTITLTSTLVATAGDAFGFTGAFGSFTGTVSSVSVSGTSFNRDLVAILATGSFTSAAPPFGSPVTTAPASLTFSATQTGGPGTRVSASFTLAVIDPNGGDPDIIIPAPMSLALFGLALAGFGLAVRRRA